MPRVTSRELYIKDYTRMKTTINHLDGENNVLNLHLSNGKRRKFALTIASVIHEYVTNADLPNERLFTNNGDLAPAVRDKFIKNYQTTNGIGEWTDDKFRKVFSLIFPCCVTTREGEAGLMADSYNKNRIYLKKPKTALHGPVAPGPDHIKAMADMQKELADAKAAQTTAETAQAAAETAQANAEAAKIAAEAAQANAETARAKAESDLKALQDQPKPTNTAAQIEQLEQNLAAANATVAANEAQVNNFQATLATKTQEVNDAKALTEAAAINLTNAQNALNTANANALLVPGLNEQIAALNISKTAAETQIQSLNARIKELETEANGHVCPNNTDDLTSLRQQLQDAQKAQNSITELQGQLTEITIANDALQSTVGELTLKLSDANKKHSDASRKQKSAEDSVKRLEAQVLQITADKQAALAEGARLKGEINTLKAAHATEIATLRQELAAKAAEVEKTKAEADKAKAEAEAEKAEAEKAKAEAKATNATLEAVKANVATLTRENAELKQQCASLTLQLEEQKQRYEQKINEYKEFFGRKIAELEANNATLTTELVAARVTIGTTAGVMKELAALKATLSQSPVNNAREVVELRNEIASLKHNLATTQAELENTARDNTIAQRARIDLTNQVKALEEQIAETESRYQAAIARVPASPKPEIPATDIPQRIKQGGPLLVSFYTKLLAPITLLEESLNHKAITSNSELKEKLVSFISDAKKSAEEVTDQNWATTHADMLTEITAIYKSLTEGSDERKIVARSAIRLRPVSY